MLALHEDETLDGVNLVLKKQNGKMVYRIYSKPLTKILNFFATLTKIICVNPFHSFYNCLLSN